MDKINNIKNHLEFLGYSVESDTNPNGNRFLNATSEGKPNLSVWFGKSEQNPQHTIFTSTWNGVKKVNTIEQFAYINQLNADLTITKAFIDFDDDTLMFRAIYTGEYEKKGFGDFVDLFLSGIRQGMHGDVFSKLFLAEKK